MSREGMESLCPFPTKLKSKKQPFQTQVSIEIRAPCRLNPPTNSSHKHLLGIGHGLGQALPGGTEP